MRGGTMATETPSIPTKQMKLARPLPMWRLTCDSVIGRVASRWMRWMNRRSRSTTGIGIALLWIPTCLPYSLLRYNEDTAAIQRFGEGGEEMSDEITQQTLLPEVKDPNLWMVKCR